MTLERIPAASLEPADFLRRFFSPELPVILTGVLSAELQPAKLTARMGDSRVAVNKTWYQTEASVLEDLIPIPGLVKAALDPGNSYTRARNQRVWINFQGHLTPFHADVNGLYVFNLQVCGKKRWRILSPDSRVRLYPFTQIAAVSQNNQLPRATEGEAIDFVLEEGEMLFLPPYWFHRVLSEGLINVNMNWVGTKRERRPNRLATRERELMRLALPFQRLRPLRKLTDLLLGSREPDYLRNYAGNGGLPLVRALAGESSALRACARLAREVLQFPRLILDWKKLRSFEVSPAEQRRRHEALP